MSLTIQSFGSRHSFEMVRDDIIIGGLAYLSDMRSPKGSAAFAAAKAHVHGIDVDITSDKSNLAGGATNYDVIKQGKQMGDLRFDWKGKGTLKLRRVDGGEDTFKIKPRGVNSWWFSVEQNGYPIVELRPTTKYSKEAYNFDVRPKSRRMPSRIMDELCIYLGFAANVYMAKMAESSRGR